MHLLGSCLQSNRYALHDLRRVWANHVGAQHLQHPGSLLSFWTPEVAKEKPAPQNVGPLNAAMCKRRLCCTDVALWYLQKQNQYLNIWVYSYTEYQGEFLA